MSSIDVTMVRIYLTESEGRLKTLFATLHDEEQVSGVTVFRGISGFGRSGKVHSSSLLDLSMDLPVIVEFFDEPGKVEAILSRLEDSIDPGHIVSWPAVVNA